MLRRLTLERFKSFERAEMGFGPFTVVVGPNASGKSNLRDGLRFLHGVARGYSLAEIIGEKWGEGGLEWRGIRGGLLETGFNGAGSFGLEVAFDLYHDEGPRDAVYQIVVDVGDTSEGPRVAYERYSVSEDLIFEATRDGKAPESHLNVRLSAIPEFKLASSQPALSQIGRLQFAGDSSIPAVERFFPFAAIFALGRMRFLDLNPDAMRFPSLPGPMVIGDRGEHLSSILQAICGDEAKKRALLGWMRELTPMDVVDFEFPADQTGRVLVTLVEESGRRVSAYSASDGTLRFLAMIAALMGPESARFYFFEEIENGLHPTRLALLLQLIEQHTARGDVQVVATTHSAELLGLLGRDAQSHIVESYRREGSEATELTPVINLPDARRVIEEQGLARLHASGWIEDAVEFSAPDAAA